MKRKIFSVLLALVLALSFSLMTTTPVRAAAISSTATGGNWSATTTWAGGVVPGAADTVTIVGGATVTVDVANAASSTLRVGQTTGGASVGTLSFTSAGILTIGTTLTVGNNANRQGSISMASGGTLAIGTTVTIDGGLTWTPGTGTVNYNGAAQTVDASFFTSYNNLTLSGSGAKTTTGVTVNGILSMEDTATASATITYGAAATLQYNTATARTIATTEWITPFAATGGVIIANTGTITLDAAKVFNASVPLTINSGATLAASSFQLTLGGNFVTNGTFTAGTGTVVYNGAAQTIAPLTYNDLTINQSSGSATLGGNATVNGILTLTSGNIATGSNTVIIGSSGSVSRTSGHVVGNLQRYVVTGATSRTFEVGTASDYNPVAVAFGNVTVAGNLTAKATTGEHPNIASSRIKSTKNVNAYWTLTNSGITFDSYNATFTFVSGDVDVGANTSIFIVGRYSGGWTYPTIGTRTATSTQATGLTSLSDFAVGDSWDSYNDAAHTVPDDLFDASGDTVYMYGLGFQASYSSYAVAYYDGSVTGGGQKVATDSGLLSGASGNLSSQYLLMTDPGATAGTWHAVVFDTALSSPPATYNEVAGLPGYVIDDSFEATAAAIPEFPTIIASIVVAGLCFAIYYWMRRRSLTYVKA